jgi:hypothetical protein
MWNLILVRSEMVLVSVQDRCMVCAKCIVGSVIVLDVPHSKVTWLKWKLVSIRLEIVLILMQDCCTVCAEYTIG